MGDRPSPHLKGETCSLDIKSCMIKLMDEMYKQGVGYLETIKVQ